MKILVPLLFVVAVVAVLYWFYMAQFGHVVFHL